MRNYSKCFFSRLPYSTTGQPLNWIIWRELGIKTRIIEWWKMKSFKRLPLYVFPLSFCIRIEKLIGSKIKFAENLYNEFIYFFSHFFPFPSSVLYSHYRSAFSTFKFSIFSTHHKTCRAKTYNQHLEIYYSFNPCFFSTWIFFIKNIMHSKFGFCTQQIHSQREEERETERRKRGRAKKPYHMQMQM